MCRYNEILSKSNKGKVCISKCSRCVGIDFGNIVLMHNYEALLEFFDSVQDCYLCVGCKADRDIRDLCFATKIPNMFLQFSENEIGELYHLLQSAILKYELNV